MDVLEGGKMIKKLFEKIRNKFFDYVIVGEYLDYVGGNRYQVKYIKKYYPKNVLKKG